MILYNNRRDSINHKTFFSHTKKSAINLKKKNILQKIKIKLKLLQNLKTKIVTKLKTQIVTQLKNSNSDNSKNLIVAKKIIVTKLKKKSICEWTKKQIK